MTLCVLATSAQAPAVTEASRLDPASFLVAVMVLALLVCLHRLSQTQQRIARLEKRLKAPVVQPGVLESSSEEERRIVAIISAAVLEELGSEAVIVKIVTRQDHYGWSMEGRRNLHSHILR